MHLDEGKYQARQSRPAIDPCKVDKLKKLARETEILAMELVCEVYGNVTGSGHAEPPVPDGGGSARAFFRRTGNGEGAGSSTNGSGHAEPPVPILDALVCVAHGAKEVCDGCDKLA